MSFLTDKILKGFDEGLLTGMALINFQKAFNRIDHEILLQKLKAIKFSKGNFTDLIFLSEHFLLILKVSSQILEKVLVGYDKGLF